MLFGYVTDPTRPGAEYEYDTFRSARVTETTCPKLSNTLDVVTPPTDFVKRPNLSHVYTTAGVESEYTVPDGRPSLSNVVVALTPSGRVETTWEPTGDDADQGPTPLVRVRYKTAAIMAATTL